MKKCLHFCLGLILGATLLIEAEAVTLEEVITAIEKNYINNDDIPSREEMYKIAINALLKELGDEHGSFLTADDYQRTEEMRRPTHYGGLNIHIGRINEGHNTRIIIYQIFDGSPLKMFDIEPGDIISHVNGELITEENYYDMMNKIRGQIGSDIRITLATGRAIGELTFQRVSSRAEYVFATHRNCFLHLRITSVTRNPEPDIIRKVQPILNECGGGTRGMILDLRHNLGGSLLGGIEVADMFLEKSDIILKQVGKEEIQYESKYDSVFPTEMPLVILIDEQTASSAEIIAGAINRHRGFNTAILGTKSYGKGSIQNLLRMADGKTAVKITIATFLVGGDIPIDGIGIDPNVIVEQPEAPGIDQRYKIVNSVLIRNQMNPRIDHQLSSAYFVIAHMASNPLMEDKKKHAEVLIQALKEVENKKPENISHNLCIESGLKACPLDGNGIHNHLP